MKTTDKILFVDDDESILAAHRRPLRQDFPDRHRRRGRGGPRAPGQQWPLRGGVESAKAPVVSVKR
jgi:hypothetical protein